MADEIFKQRKKLSMDEFETERALPPRLSTDNPMDKIESIQKAVAHESGQNMPEHLGDHPFAIQGNLPPSFKEALRNRTAPAEPVNQQEMPSMPLEGSVRPKPTKTPVPVSDAQFNDKRRSTPELEAVLVQLEKFNVYDQIELPSKSKFYSTIPPVIHIRPMTGEEENILAQPRHVKKGDAVDMIFKNVIRENINTYELLAADRMYLLIYLRGISYTPEYDVEVRCPACTTSFSTMIDLNLIDVEMCPDDLDTESLIGVLPKSGVEFEYRFPTGEDDRAITRHRKMRVEQYGDQNSDDTVMFRSALLLERIGQVTNKHDLMHILKKLPVADVNYIRNKINDPPFGVDTEVGLVCPSCAEEFEIELPFESDFFFPRKKEDQTQA